ncbi:MAG: DUF1385 domain-containing protein [Polyangiaceae bacterium]
MPTSTAPERTEAPVPDPAARPYIGGQAVLEGVMMRAPTSFAVVVRRADGSLVVRERPMPSLRKGMSRWPLFRGVASLVESLKLGSEALRFSAEQMEKDMELEATKEASAASRASSTWIGLGVSAWTSALFRAASLAAFHVVTTDADVPDDTDESGEAGVVEAARGSEVARSNANVNPPALGKTSDVDGRSEKKSNGGMAFMLVVMVSFFIALPQAAATVLNKVLHLGLELQSPAFQVITGALKLGIVIGYMALIRRIPDIRRVFQYHGAEHKTISTYEANEALTVDNARAKTTLHPRCGTTFLVMVALVSILVFTAVGALLPRIATGNIVADNLVFLLMKLPFLPVITAVTFELQRFSARYCTTGPLRVLLVPGFLVQKITTIEPDDAQLEVALASLRATLFRERAEDTGSDVVDVSFPNYAELSRAERLRSAA